MSTLALRMRTARRPLTSLTIVFTSSTEKAFCVCNSTAILSPRNARMPCPHRTSSANGLSSIAAAMAANAGRETMRSKLTNSQWALPWRSLGCTLSECRLQHAAGVHRACAACELSSGHAASGRARRGSVDDQRVGRPEPPSDASTSGVNHQREAVKGKAHRPFCEPFPCSVWCVHSESARRCLARARFLAACACSYAVRAAHLPRMRGGCGLAETGEGLD
jgi:hypothetical protein